MPAAEIRTQAGAAERALSVWGHHLSYHGTVLEGFTCGGDCHSSAVRWGWLC